MQDAKKWMSDAIDHFVKELKNLRTGRASTGLVEDLPVEVYGSHMPMKSLGNITIAEGRQILVTPFDPQTAPSIAKSIEKANLNLQAIVDGHQVRIPVPPLSEDVRKEIVKQAKKKSEDAKIVIREMRRKAIDVKKKEKVDGIITEDQLKKFEKSIQTLTDDSCKEVDRLLALKEKEIMTV